MSGKQTAASDVSRRLVTVCVDVENFLGHIRGRNLEAVSRMLRRIHTFVSREELKICSETSILCVHRSCRCFNRLKAVCAQFGFQACHPASDIPAEIAIYPHLQMLIDQQRGSYDIDKNLAFVISGDSDLYPIIELVHAAGHLVWVSGNSLSTSRKLKQSPRIARFIPFHEIRRVNQLPNDKSTLHEPLSNEARTRIRKINFAELIRRAYQEMSDEKDRDPVGDLDELILQAITEEEQKGTVTTEDFLTLIKQAAAEGRQTDHSATELDKLLKQ